MVLGVIAKSEANDAQIHAMQTLPYDDQMVLMRVIERVLAAGDARDDATPTPDAADTSLVADARDSPRAIAGALWGRVLPDVS